MNKSIISVAMLAGLVLSGAASAAQQSDNVELVLNVIPGCSLELFDNSLDSVAGFIGGYVGGSNTVASRMIVVCTADLPYTIENDAVAGGRVELMGQNTASVINAHFRLGSFLQGGQSVAWSSDANGEAYAGVGNGLIQNIDYFVRFNTPANGSNLFVPIPEADVYTHTSTITLSFL